MLLFTGVASIKYYLGKELIVEKSKFFCILIAFSMFRKGRYGIRKNWLQKVRFSRNVRRQKTVIRQWKDGKKTSEIQRNTGLCINTVRETIRKYKEGGLKALRPKKEGRPKGSGTRLTLRQSLEVQSIIIDKDPKQLKLPFALWNRKAVKEVIADRYGIELPIRTVGEYLKRWGFTPQKPAKVSRRQSNEAVQKWLGRVDTKQ